MCSSSLDAGNIPAPRPWDALAQRCAQEARQALEAELVTMPLSRRRLQKARWAELQKARRAQLEALIWVELPSAALGRLADLIELICSEGSWAEGEALDDVSRPEIDLQAVETGALLAWVLRRHGARLAEREPRLPGRVAAEIRQRLLSPLLAHDDYPFLRGGGRFPALMLSELLLSCLLTQGSAARRQGVVRLLLGALDELCARPDRGDGSCTGRLVDACALADLARLLKRLTRGELDLTGACPPDAWLDALSAHWLGGEYFFDPEGEDMRPPLSGMDLYRLGYLCRDRALCALGAQLQRRVERPCFSVSGRVLAMEYRRAASEETAPVPRLRRADTGRILLARVAGLCAALSTVGARGNVGDVALCCGGEAVLADCGGEQHNLPRIDARCVRPGRISLPAAVDFGEERDLLSVDLTDAYPPECGLLACQRTLMTMQGDGTVRLIDAFEFQTAPQVLEFCFVSAQEPKLQGGGLRLGPVLLHWDPELDVVLGALGGTAAFPDGAWLVRLVLRKVPRRLICGFRFEEAGEE